MLLALTYMAERGNLYIYTPANWALRGLSEQLEV